MKLCYVAVWFNERRNIRELCIVIYYSVLKNVPFSVAAARFRLYFIQQMKHEQVHHKIIKYIISWHTFNAISDQILYFSSGDREDSYSFSWFVLAEQRCGEIDMTYGYDEGFTIFTCHTWHFLVEDFSCLCSFYHTASMSYAMNKLWRQEIKYKNLHLKNGVRERKMHKI